MLLSPSLLFSHPHRKKIQSVTEISFFQQGKHSFDQMAFSRRKNISAKKTNHKFFQSCSCGNTKKYAVLFVRQLFYHLWLAVSYFNKSPIRTNTKHIAYLCLRLFLVSCLLLRQKSPKPSGNIMIIHLQREVWQSFPSNSFRTVYETLFCSSTPNVFFLEYNKPNSEPLQTEDLPKVTPTDSKTFAAHQHWCRVHPKLALGIAIPNLCHRPSSHSAPLAWNAELC